MLIWYIQWLDVWLETLTDFKLNAGGRAWNITQKIIPNQTMIGESEK